MNKLLFFALVTLGITNIQAQETQTSERQNDIMLSPIELIASPLLNVSYERLLSENSGVGINGMFYFGDHQNDNYDSGFTQISPYYRMYFGKKYASGFFVEGFVPITMTKDYSYFVSAGPGYFNEYYTEQKRTTVGIGVGFGGKWVARKNIVFEASAGVGRRFGNEKNNNYENGGDNITGKGMLGIGYRF